jgi:hypothetical protein
MSSSFSQWLEQNPDEDVSTQTTQPNPLPVPPIVIESDPNCVACLMEFAEKYGPDDMPIEPGSFGLCLIHQSSLDEATPEALEVIRQLMRVGRIRYELRREGGR